MRNKFLALALLFSGLGTVAGFADGKVWVGLYLAENVPPPPNAVHAPEKLGHRLREVFGFKHYELLGKGEIELGHNWQQWVVPRKDFFIRLEPLHRQGDGPKMVDYEIYKDAFIVAKGRFEPREDTPLFINGPDFKEGRLVFVLEERD